MEKQYFSKKIKIFFNKVNLILTISLYNGVNRLGEGTI